MTCPNCHLENPPSAVRCDCGYPFVTAGGQNLSVRLCQRCRRHVVASERFCPFCGMDSMWVAPLQAPKKSSGALVFGLLAAGIFIFLWSNASFPHDALKATTTERKVTYVVGGSTSSARLTYRNESGGTEQRTVSLPWTLEMRAVPGQFLYLSAQKKQTYGTVKTSIEIEGQVLQEAESDTEYGIASASGRVPR